MRTGYAERIRQRIDGAGDGTMFISADFADIAENETIRRSLNRLVKTGTLRRVLKGIYEKPRYSTLLREHVAPDPDAVARAIARNYHWTIAPEGNTALNLLGLSPQVPATWHYISDGPYKVYEWNNTRLVFKHRTNKEISGLSPITALVVQALKALGKGQVTPETVVILSKRLRADEKALLLREATTATDWVYDVIRQLSGGGSAR